MSASPRPLVVNADDAGLHPDTDAAILHCHAHGVVRSASVVANGPTVEAFVEAARAAGLDLGLHVNLTEGWALTGPIEGLTDERGRFLGTPRKAAVLARLAAGRVAVDAEVRAQWARLVALGAAPTHVDGHNHVHLAPCVAAVLGAVAPGTYLRRPVDPDGSAPAWLPVPSRPPEGLRRLDAWIGHAFAASPGLDVLRRGLAACPGATEWMVHPGRRPGSLFVRAPDRERERALLCSTGLRALLRELGFAPTSFQALDAERRL